MSDALLNGAGAQPAPGRRSWAGAALLLVVALAVGFAGSRAWWALLGAAASGVLPIFLASDVGRNAHC